MNYRIVAAAVAAAISLTTLPLFGAYAAEGVTYVTAPADGVRVAYLKVSDLNLQDATAQRILKQRIRGASRNVCGHSPSKRSLDETVSVLKCVNTAYAGGIEQMTAMIDKGVEYAGLDIEVVNSRH